MLTKRQIPQAKARGVVKAVPRAEVGAGGDADPDPNLFQLPIYQNFQCVPLSTLNRIIVANISVPMVFPSITFVCLLHQQQRPGSASQP